VDGREERGEARRVDILHEVDARRAGAGAEALIGERAERLAAETRAADAEYQDMREAATEHLGDRRQLVEIIAPRRQAQEGQAAIIAPAAQRSQRRLRAAERMVELRAGQPARSNLFGKAPGDVMTILHRLGARRCGGTLPNAVTIAKVHATASPSPKKGMDARTKCGHDDKEKTPRSGERCVAS